MGIIGINGKIGSGKDTVAKLKNYIDTGGEKIYNSLEGFLEYYSDGLGKYPWEIKKFGYKLKEIASLLTGIPIQDFEKQEIKAKVLGPEWVRWEIVRFPDDSSEGAYTVAHLASEADAEEYLREDRRKLDEINSKMYGGFVESWLHIEKKEMTVRDLLQKIGTDCMRNHLHVNTWVNALFADYNPKYEDYGIEMKEQFIYPNWIISDMRFPNEMEAVKERGGMTVRVVRPNNPYPSSNHASETSLDDAEFDIEIINDGSLEDLYIKVKSIEPLIRSIG
jgi:hypothetical protein